ncbi:MAG: phosphatase PAP2 family protein [Myxococcota bacterium]
MDANSSSFKQELSLGRRFAEAVAVALAVSVVYFGTGTRMMPSAEPFVLPVDRWVPFVPETVWMYMPGYAACFLVTLWVVRDAESFRAALAAFGLLTVLAVPFFTLLPVAGPRPPAPVDATLSAQFVRWLYANDPNVNTFPSLHVANATLCAVITSHVDRRWGAVVWALAAGICVSVLTLKQHWAADVPAGWALATAGVAAWRSRSLVPAFRARIAGLLARDASEPWRALARRPTDRRRRGW